MGVDKIYQFQAPAAEGFGGKDFYKEYVRVIESTYREARETLEREKRKFALKYKVELESIKCIDVTAEAE